MISKKSVKSLNGILTGTTTLRQSGPGSNGNEVVTPYFFLESEGNDDWAACFSLYWKEILILSLETNPPGAFIEDFLDILLSSTSFYWNFLKI